VHGRLEAICYRQAGGEDCRARPFEPGARAGDYDPLALRFIAGNRRPDKEPIGIVTLDSRALVQV